MCWRTMFERKVEENVKVIIVSELLKKKKEERYMELREGQLRV